jgi:TonB family protein
VLVAEIEPVHGAKGSGEMSCFFSDYQKFGDRVFARSYECAESGHPRLEARIVELVAEPKTDPELFTPPNGAKESTGCPDPIRPARVVHMVDPVAPAGSGMVVVAVSIGIDGAPHGLSVVSSPDPKLEKAALEAVRQWRFRPATCDGEPVEMKSEVDVATYMR